MMKIKSSLYCLTMLLTLTAQVAVARPSILAAWQSAYPASDSDLVNCQLCHQNTSGGNPWNAYGWNIRQGIQNSGLAASAAIAAIEGNNSDASVVSASNNLEEISANTQPGWTARGCQYHLLQKRLYTHQPDRRPRWRPPSILQRLPPFPFHLAWLALLGLSLAWVGMFRRLNRRIK